MPLKQVEKMLKQVQSGKNDLITVMLNPIALKVVTGYGCTICLVINRNLDRAGKDLAQW